jgi:heterodisulfide reductase subunit C
MIFDEEFADQVIATGKIEDSRVIRGFFRKTGQPLLQDWLVAMVKRIARRLPVAVGIKMALAAVFRPRTKGWARNRAAIEEYVAEQDTKQRKALGLGDAK